MITDLVTTDWFDSQKESRPIRFIQHEGTTYVPILDLASSTGMRKRSLLKVVSKNPADFERHTKSLQLETVRGLQGTDCLDRDGAMLLMFKVSTNHIRNPDTKARIEDFKKWQIQKMNQPLALPAPKEPDYAAALNAARFAKELSGITGTDPIPLICQALDKFDLGMYGGLLVPKSTGAVQVGLVLPALPKLKDYLTSKDIGEIIGKSAHEVNMFLYQIKPPLLIKDLRGEWELTEYGKGYGEARSYEASPGYIVWRIKWKKDILGLFNMKAE